MSPLPTPGKPFATVAVYGPDNTLATKLVLAIVLSANQEPSILRKWFVVDGDVRHDRMIAAEVAALLAQHHINDIVRSDRVIGCPHEEGIDYPMGRTCPECPFWTNIDRFTHEPIVVPAPTMTPSEILSVLADSLTEPPIDAYESAEGHREALIEPLLGALDRGIADPVGASERDANLFSHALYLFAKWRDTRAYGHVCRWLSLPDEAPFEIAGDVATQDGARILAPVCDGDLTPIKALILNRDADVYGRSAGVGALALLAAWAEVPRPRVVDLLVSLVRERLERESNHVWDSIASWTLDIEADELLPDIRQAYADGLVDPLFMSLADIDDAIAKAPGWRLAATRHRWVPIDDVADATSWWSCYQEAKHDRQRVLQTPRTSTKVGRNEPCPCGSGKKYKKCCGQ